MVTMKLHLYLINFTNKEEIEITVKETMKIEELLQDIGIPKDEVGIITKNGRWVTTKSLISDGDHIEIFPYLLGG